MSEHHVGIHMQPARSRYGLVRAELRHVRWLAQGSAGENHFPYSFLDERYALEPTREQYIFS